MHSNVELLARSLTHRLVNKNAKAFRSKSSKGSSSTLKHKKDEGYVPLAQYVYVTTSCASIVRNDFSDNCASISRMHDRWRHRHVVVMALFVENKLQ